jgi:NAD+ kinase
MIENVGIYFNITQDEIIRITEHIVALLNREHVAIYSNDEHAAERLGVKYLQNDAFVRSIELMLVVGGDGTFLRAAEIVRDNGVPLLGINRGHLGFLSQLEVAEFEEHLADILQGRFKVEERMTVVGTIRRDGRTINQVVGLNDVIINRNPLENTITYEIFLEDECIDRYQGDGMIFATATGSTGYSLSAGGPLIYPGTDCLIINPICPHIIGSRAVIVPAEDKITFKLTHCEDKAFLVTDGRDPIILHEGDEVCLCKGQQNVHMVQFGDHLFFEAVRNKLLNRNYRRMYHGSGSNEE